MLPLLPLRDAVALPMALLPISISQDRSVRLIEALGTEAPPVLVLALQRSAEAPAQTRADLFDVATTARVHQVIRGPEGEGLIIQGIERVRIGDLTQTTPFLAVNVARAPETEDAGTDVDALVATVRSLFERLVSVSADLPDALAVMAHGLTRPLQLAYFVAAGTPMEARERQEILEADAASDKLRRLVVLLQHALAVHDLEAKITSETQEHMNRAQREFFLRQQMRSIQKELGEAEEGSDAPRLKKKLAGTALSAEANAEAGRELSRLGPMAPGSPEYGMIVSWLDWLLDLPWGRRTGGALDVARARAVLDEDHYDLDKIKERLLDHLAVRKLRADRAEEAGSDGQRAEAEAGGRSLPLEGGPAEREPILCFVGPPGTGKTSLGQSIARAMGRRFARASLGGVHDESEIRGHRRTYIGALPGRIVQTLRRAGAADPVLMLDEVDKLSASFQGDPAAALLEVLDPAENQAFVDTYLGVAFDLSRVLFICTANTVETIPPPLLDRMEVLSLSSYTTAEKLEIGRRFLLPRQLQANGLRPEELELPAETMRAIIDGWTHEAGVRALERELSAVARKAARRIGEGAAAPIRVAPRDLPLLLGPQRFFAELAERMDRPGVATGLAWTPVGGEILFVEAAAMPGKEGLILTGMLGEVMRESAQAALSLLRSSAAALGMPEDVFRRKQVHVHVPAGAIPKDGPSAGVAILAALASLASGRRCAADAAMTGEITLRGKVLPVGGIKEKALAAWRAGVRTLVLPRRNEAALEELPKEVRDGLRFVFVGSAEEALREVLEPARAAAPWGELPARQAGPPM